MLLLKRNEKKPLTEFIFDDNGYIATCPAQHLPEQVKHKEKTVRYNTKQYRLAVRPVAEKTEAFKDSYRWRLGVEMTMREYESLTDVKKFRVSDKQAVRFCAKMKTAGLNMFRAARAQRTRQCPKRIIGT